MEKKSYKVISCPVCGREYVPSEIFVPKYFMGTIKDKMLDENGKIELFNGTDMDLEETYICDGCHNHMKIRAKVDFEVSSVFDGFEEEYSYPLQKGIKLSEE